jgi:putative transposase
MQNLKYKYRLYPSQEQIQLLNQVVGNNRYVWNHFLNQEMQQYQIDNKFRFFNKNSADLTSLKKATEWLQSSPSTSLQQTIRYLDVALKASFKKNSKATKGFPKFKKKRNFNGSFTLAMVNSDRNCDFNSGKFKIPNIGWIKCRYHRALPSDFKTCQIKQEAHNWFVVVTCTKPKLPTRTTTTNSVGIDLNSSEYVLSNGIRYVIPKFLRENQAKIKKLQRGLSRKKKGSHNYLKAQLKLTKANYRVKLKRLDYFHKLSRQLVDDYDVISLEDLNVKSIQQWNGHIIKDNGFAMLRQFIEYKSELYGGKTVIIDRYYPSSKTCSNCGSIQDIELSSRTYDCKSCGEVIDRDLNAAINIDRAGTARLNACGDPRYDQLVMIGQLLGINESGSLVL